MGEEAQPDRREEIVYAAVTYQGKRTEIRISSHAVCLASPVWKKALSFPRLADEKEPTRFNVQPPPHDKSSLDEFELVGDDPAYLGQLGSSNIREIHPSTPRKVVDLTEDDADSALLLLRIAHLQFRKVPSDLSYDALRNVAKLSDYYDCIEIIEPWRSCWLQMGAAESAKAGQEEWLTIAWVFNSAMIFESLTRRLVLELTADSQGKCHTSLGQVSLPLNIVGRLRVISPWTSLEFTLTKALEDIMSCRQTFIENLLAVPYARVNNYMDSAANGGKVCGWKSEECDAIRYGSLLMSLQSHHLWPQKSPKDVTMSISSLISELKLIQTLTYTDRYYPDHHRTCGMAGYMEEITNVVKKIHGPVLSSYRRAARSKQENRLL